MFKYLRARVRGHGLNQTLLIPYKRIILRKGDTIQLASFLIGVRDKLKIYQISIDSTRKDFLYYLHQFLYLYKYIKCTIYDRINKIKWY